MLFLPRRLLAVLALLLLASALSFSTSTISEGEEVFKQPELPAMPQGADIYFRDSFMREKPEEGEWTKISGSWTFDQAAKPGVSANPFSVQGRSTEVALMETGWKWWRDYVFSAAVRTPPIFNSFGVMSCRRGDETSLFFGFTASEGIVLKFRHEGKEHLLASQKKFPMPYQWYKLSIAVHGKKVYALIDDGVVFEVDLPVLTCGKAALVVTGAPDYGMTVDDCAATGIKGTPEEVAADAQNGFQKLFQMEHLTAQKFPSYFSTDPLMRKWASSESDWQPFCAPEPTEENKFPVPTQYSFPLPIFNDFAMGVKFPDLSRVADITLMEYEDDDSAGTVYWNLRIKPSGNIFEAELCSVGGKRVGEVLKFSEPNKFVIIQASGNMLKIGNNQPMDVPGLGKKLSNGVRVVISSETYEICKVGNLSLTSNSIIDESFFAAPSSWLTVFGNWEIGSRWACSPQYTYLASWDPMTSQLYSKNLYGGKLYADVLISAKMSSFKSPSYYPLKLFSVSLPDVEGDLSSGLTVSAAYPTADEIAMFDRGKMLQSMKIDEKMTPSALHNAWMRLRIQRGDSKTNFLMSILDKRPKTNTYTLSIPNGADSKMRPFVVWNSLTGLTVPRVRISAQKIDRGGLASAYVENASVPCGVPTDLTELENEDRTVFRAPDFDFSQGSAGWMVPSNQPGLVVEPTEKKGIRTGLQISSKFCGSRLAFESPKMKVDARVWQKMNIKFRANSTLSLYIHSGLRKFRLILNDRKTENKADWAIPIDLKFLKRSFGGGFGSVSIDLLNMFEEYQTLAIPPIIDRITIERIDLDSNESLGLEAKDDMVFSIASLSFSSSYQSSAVEPKPYDAPEMSKINPIAESFWKGLGIFEVKLPEAKAKLVYANQGDEEYIEKKGCLVLSFKDGFQTLSPVGSFGETQLWRQRINKEEYVTANKTEHFGFFGFKVLPEPVSIIEAPAMTMKYRGNVDTLQLMVKADGIWNAIPLKPLASVDVSKSKGKGSSKLSIDKISPTKVVMDEEAWLLFDFANCALLNNVRMIEEVFICSRYGQTIGSGFAVSISSVAFYNPAQIGKLTRKTKATGDLGSIFDKDKQVRQILEAKLGRIKTLVFVDNEQRDDDRVQSATLTELEGGKLHFKVDAEVSKENVRVKIGKQVLCGNQLSYGASACDLLVDRAIVYNSEVGAISWEFEIRRGIEWRSVGSGECTLQEKNHPIVSVLSLVPDTALVFEDYEHGIGGGSSRKSLAVVASGDAYQGKYNYESVSLHVNRLNSYLRVGKFDAVEYPFMSFEYRANGTNCDVMFRCEGHYKDVMLDTDPIPSLNKYKDIYYRVGPSGDMTLGIMSQLPGIKIDNRWHHCQFEIMKMLKGEPFNGKYIISEVALREFGVQAKGASVGIDNFCIFGPGAKTFRVNAMAPFGFSEENTEYEWWLTDSQGKQVTPPTLEKTGRFEVTLPARNLSFHLRAVVSGKASERVFTRELLFSR